MLGVFLNRCARMREIREDSVFQRFLDSNASWVFTLSLARNALLTSDNIYIERSIELTPNL